MAWTLERQQEYFRLRRAEQRGRGICQGCGRRPVTEGMNTCEVCRDRTRKRHRVYIDAGLCSGCGQRPSLETQTGQDAGRLCDVCYFKFVARRYCGATHLWTQLRDQIIKQQYQCPYTGEQLILGLNTSLDHIQPKGRFPELAQSLDNMQWVSTDANTIKHDRTPDEFIERMITMLTHLGYSVIRQ